MAPADIIGATCEQFLPSVVERLAARRACSLFPPRNHVVQASYGKSKLSTLLKMFEFCTPECTWHGREVDLKISPWQRFLCLQALSEINELPGDIQAEEFRAFCKRECEKYMAQVCGDHTLITTEVPATPRSARISGKGARHSPMSTPTKTLGRKPLPRFSTTFYVYTEDHCPPASADVEGILEANGLIRFPFYDARVRVSLNKVFDRKPGQRLAHRFQMWDGLKSEWVPPPRASETLTLKPGEGRIFKRVEVQHVHAFEIYERVTMPFEALCAASPYPVGSRSLALADDPPPYASMSSAGAMSARPTTKRVASPTNDHTQHKKQLVFKQGKSNHVQRVDEGKGKGKGKAEAEDVIEITDDETSDTE